MNDDFVKRVLIVTNMLLVFWCSLLTWQQIRQAPTDIAQLSVRELFDDYLKEQALSQGANSDPALLEASTAAYTRELEAILKDLSGKENVIILVSEAVLSDHVADITPEIKLILKTRLEEREDE
tara:strand:+ start:1905 stop:2276 length:372 start_codon:yes stop_codon:yes gene_type:complete